MNAICYISLAAFQHMLSTRVSLIFIIRENLVKTSTTTMQWIIYRRLKTDSEYLNSNRRYSYSNKGGHFWDTWKSCFLHRTNYQCSFNCTVLIHLWGIKNIENIIRKKKSWQNDWLHFVICKWLASLTISVVGL